MNLLRTRIPRFLWCTMIRVILDHSSSSRSSQRNAPLNLVDRMTQHMKRPSDKWSDLFGELSLNSLNFCKSWVITYDHTVFLYSFKVRQKTLSFPGSFFISVLRFVARLSRVSTKQSKHLGYATTSRQLLTRLKTTGRLPEYVWIAWPAMTVTSMEVQEETKELWHIRHPVQMRYTTIVTKSVTLSVTPCVVTVTDVNPAWQGSYVSRKTWKVI